MKLATSEFDTNEQSVQSLTAKNESLTKLLQFIDALGCYLFFCGFEFNASSIWLN